MKLVRIAVLFVALLTAGCPSRPAEVKVGAGVGPAWEVLEAPTDSGGCYRMRAPGGWIYYVRTGYAGGPVFVPDRRGDGGSDDLSRVAIRDEVSRQLARRSDHPRPGLRSFAIWIADGSVRQEVELQRNAIQRAGVAPIDSSVLLRIARDNVLSRVEMAIRSNALVVGTIKRLERHGPTTVLVFTATAFDATLMEAVTRPDIAGIVELGRLDSRASASQTRHHQTEH